MLLALPRYKPEKALRKTMLPLIASENVEAFHRSYFINEYWLKWKNGEPQRPGFTPFGLEEHEGKLLIAIEEYARGVWRRVIDAVVVNQREFVMNDVMAKTLGLPDDLLLLTRNLAVAPLDATALFGLRLVDCAHFKHGVIFSAPEFGRYLAFPAREEEHEEDKVYGQESES
jgi:hypothetical protein